MELLDTHHDHAGRREHYIDDPTTWIPKIWEDAVGVLEQSFKQDPQTWKPKFRELAKTWSSVEARRLLIRDYAMSLGGMPDEYIEMPDEYVDILVQSLKKNLQSDKSVTEVREFLQALHSANTIFQRRMSKKSKKDVPKAKA